MKIFVATLSFALLTPLATALEPKVVAGVTYDTEGSSDGASCSGKEWKTILFGGEEGRRELGKCPGYKNPWYCCWYCQDYNKWEGECEVAYPCCQKKPKTCKRRLGHSSFAAGAHEGIEKTTSRELAGACESAMSEAVDAIDAVLGTTAGSVVSGECLSLLRKPKRDFFCLELSDTDDDGEYDAAAKLLD